MPKNTTQSVPAQHYVEVDGRSRSFLVTGSENGSAGRNLLLLFHGSKQDGAGFRRFTGYDFDRLADGGTTVVAYLDGYRQNWNDARLGSYFPARTENIDDVAFTRSVIRSLICSHRIDPARVYAAGYSNGGQMVLRLIHETPDAISGAAVIAATMPVPDNWMLRDLSTPRPRPMPVLMIAGTADPIVSYEGGNMGGLARWLFRVDGASLSAPETARYFATRNGITAKPITIVLSQRNRRSTVWAEQTSYRQVGFPEVELITVHGGGHTVPGSRRAPFFLGRTASAISTAQLVREFFAI